MFFNMVDVGAIALTLDPPQWSSQLPHQRRLFLKQLWNELVADQLQRRLANLRAWQKGVPQAFQPLGMFLPSNQYRQNQQIPSDAVLPAALNVG